MEGRAIVEFLFGQLFEVGHGCRGDIVPKGNDHFPEIGINNGHGLNVLVRGLGLQKMMVREQNHQEDGARQGSTTKWGNQRIEHACAFDGSGNEKGHNLRWPKHAPTAVGRELRVPLRSCRRAGSRTHHFGG